MFKNLLLSSLALYQNFLSYFFKTIIGFSNTCRYEVTCSEYAKISIQKYGVVRGGIMSIKRLLSCQPFYNKGGYLA